jgi:hypothetical protein
MRRPRGVAFATVAALSILAEMVDRQEVVPYAASLLQMEQRPTHF